MTETSNCSRFVLSITSNFHSSHSIHCFQVIDKFFLICGHSGRRSFTYYLFQIYKYYIVRVVNNVHIQWVLKAFPSSTEISLLEKYLADKTFFVPIFLRDLCIIFDWISQTKQQNEMNNHQKNHTMNWKWLCKIRKSRKSCFTCILLQTFNNVDFWILHWSMTSLRSVIIGFSTSIAVFYYLKYMRAKRLKKTVIESILENEIIMKARWSKFVIFANKWHPH